MAGSLVIATEEPHAPTPRPVLLISDPSLDRIVRPFTRVLRMVSGGSDPGSLSGRAAQSGIWIGGGFVIQRVLQLGSNLILTRLLFPEAFGLMALATIFLVGINLFSDLGIKQAVIRDERGSEQTFLNTAWTIQVIRGFILFIIGAGLAYPISLIYDQPILFPLLVMLSTTAFILGFASIKMATAERDLDFKTLTLIQLSGQIFSIVTMVILAFLWRSVWALAIGNLVGSVITVALGHLLLHGHQHRFRLERTAVDTLVHFGKWIFLSSMLTYLGGEGLRAIQAGYVSPAEFGILAIAYTIAAIPIDLSLKLTASVGLPALSEASRNNPESLKRVLGKFRKHVLTLALGLVSALTLVSEPLIEILYDERYHAAGPFVIAIMLSTAVTLILAGYNNALLTLGKSQFYLFVMTATAVGRIFGTILGFHFFGIMGMIIGIGVANLATLAMIWPKMYSLKLLDLKIDMSALAVIASLILISILWF